MQQELNIDIETYSNLDLSQVGVYRYVECPDFDILLLSYSFNDEPVRTLDLISGDAIPDRVLKALQDPKVLKTAHNANFELTCLNAYLPIVYGISTPLEQWECTMVKTAMLGLPLALKAVAMVLNLSVQKDAKGKALIKYFSEPCKPTKINGQRTRNLPHHAPDKWEDYKNYNRVDVEVEKEIRQWCSFFEIPDFERQLWFQDQHINNRGVRIDLSLVESAIELDRTSTANFMKQVSLLTGIENPNSDPQVKEWLEEQGIKLPGLSKEVVSAALASERVPEMVKTVLRLRQKFKKSSIDKYAALFRAVCQDQRIKGIIQFYGANRTGRYAGRIFQPQNLTRMEEDIWGKGDLMSAARELVRRKDIDSINFVFGNLSTVLSQLIRTALIPAEGNVFITSDFSAIEARIISWLANEEWRLEVFRTHGKIYEASASKMFGVPIELCGKGTDYRSRGKVAELALGYQGSAGALVTMGALEMLKIDARSMEAVLTQTGITLKELRPLVRAWRKENPNIVKLWYDIEEQVIDCIQNDRTVEMVRGMSCEIRNGILFIKLPSGRELAYFKPGLISKRFTKFRFTEDYNEFSKDDKTVLNLDKANSLQRAGRGVIEGEPFTKKSIVYWGMNQTTKQWEKVDTYGGKLVENITQAIARDCLVFAKHNLYKEGYFTVLHVHDEVVIETEPDLSSTQEVDEIMARTPAWGKDIPLAAESYISHYYKKD